MTADDAFKRLNAIRPEFEAAIKTNQSEQDARLKLIDRILTEVLEWDYELIHTEPATDSGFVDYVLSDELKRSVCVIEAKKIGVLKIDSASPNLITANVGGSVLKRATDGISQAIRYSAEVGAVYAAVTDGVRWIFFRSTRADGLSPKSGKAFVFPSLAAILEEFSTFYELLAPAALNAQLHVARLNLLEGGHVRPAEPRYYIKDPADARLKLRSDIGRDIVEVFNRFFAAMASDQDHEMRRLCFVETRGKSRGGQHPS
jgi:hypothetical protein